MRRLKRRSITFGGLEGPEEIGRELERMLLIVRDPENVRIKTTVDYETAYACLEWERLETEAEEEAREEYSANLKRWAESREREQLTKLKAKYEGDKM